MAMDSEATDTPPPCGGLRVEKTKGPPYLSPRSRAVFVVNIGRIAKAAGLETKTASDALGFVTDVIRAWHRTRRRVCEGSAACCARVLGCCGDELLAGLLSEEREAELAAALKSAALRATPPRLPVEEHRATAETAPCSSELLHAQRTVARLWNTRFGVMIAFTLTRFEMEYDAAKHRPASTP